MRDLDFFFAPLLKQGTLCSPSKEQDLSDNSPLLEELISNQILQKGALHFDFGASGLAFAQIEQRISQILPFYANTHSQSYPNSAFTSSLVDRARAELAKDLGLDSSFALLCSGFGASGAIKKFQELLGLNAPPKFLKRLASAGFAPFINSKFTNIKEENKIQCKNLKDLQNALPLVIVGPYEHHSNELSARVGPCEVRRVGLNKDGLLNLNELTQILEQNATRQIVASFCLCSNVSGIIAPFAEISSLVRSFGGIMAFDMSASSPYFDIPCEYFDAAFYSPHKLLGGVGACGLLAIKKDLIDKSIPPTFAGGGTVGYVSRSSEIFWGDEALREEAGTPGILEFLRAFLAYRLRNEIGLEWIAERKAAKNRALAEFLSNEPKITLYGNQKYNLLGTFSFNIKGRDPFAIAEALGDLGIQVRAGCSCAGPYGHDLLGLEDNASFTSRPGWVRLSAHFTHKDEGINFLIKSLKEII